MCGGANASAGTNLTESAGPGLCSVRVVPGCEVGGVEEAGEGGKWIDGDVEAGCMMPCDGPGIQGLIVLDTVQERE